jgi:hypothetical protein
MAYQSNVESWQLEVTLIFKNFSIFLLIENFIHLSIIKNFALWECMKHIERNIGCMTVGLPCHQKPQVFQLFLQILEIPKQKDQLSSMF